MLRRDFSRLILASLSSTAICSPLRSQESGQKRGKALPNVTSARGSRYVAATVHPMATEAAMKAFERGGNAVDAAVAASLMLSVVDGHNSGLGGGGLALVRTPAGQVLAFDGRERAPLAVTPETYIRSGKPDPNLSQTGPLAAATPGLVKLLDRISSTLGKISWKDSLLGAAEVAEQGFPIDRTTARSIAATAKSIALFEPTARILLQADGSAPPEGWILKQSDLSRSLRQIESQGAAWFYEGEFASRTAEFMKQQGGLLSVKDFQSYTVESRTPIQSTYRNHQVFGFPPPSSGGIHIAQMLGMLQRYDVAYHYQNSRNEFYHLLAEVMKRAMADRAYWLGDADFAEVPTGLILADYLRERSRDIDLNVAVEVKSHGLPPRSTNDLFEDKKHTTHLTTADASGMVVALTQTVNTSYGCKMTVPGTGIVLNNEMDDFSLAPGVRNAFGLVGSAANAVAPGKRPLSSMSPTIVHDSKGDWKFSMGAAGGPKITTVTLQNLVRCIDLKLQVDEAIASPRIHHQWSPDTLSVEDKLPESIVQGLKNRLHSISVVSGLAVAQGLMRLDDQSLLAASDPRVPSSTSGW